MLIHSEPETKTINNDELIINKINDISFIDSDFWSSKKYDQRQYVHSIFHYPAMMVPGVQQKVIETILSANPNISSVYDPYVGAGSTITASMTHGLNCFGVDINPLAILISKVKSNLSWSDNELQNSLNAVIEIAKNDHSNIIDITFNNWEKWFRKDVAIDLSKLRRAILENQDLSIRQIFWVIFSETIRLACNDRTSTYKLHARPIEEILNREVNVFNIFITQGNKSIFDLIEYKNQIVQKGYLENNRYTGKINLRIGDTRSYNFKMDNSKKYNFDLLVTSPPYGDNNSTITYGQHSYLPLQCIPLSDIDLGIDENLLKTTQEIDNRSLGGRITKISEEIIDSLRQSSYELSKIFDKLNSSNQPADRTERVARFYSDFIQSIDNIQTQMSNNSYQVWTVGNRRVGGYEIPNDKILIELLTSRKINKLSEITRNIYYKRMPHKNKISQTMKQEKILIFRKSS